MDEATHVAQVQEAQPEAPVAVVVCQPEQPLGNLIVFDVAPSLVAITGLADLKGSKRGSVAITAS